MAVEDPDDLYGLPLDAFVPERDALAKRLRADGRRDEAAEVKALRKPSVAAWAVNQAVRTQSKAARELWEAGDALIRAQEDLLAGRGDARSMRAAVDRERSALGELAGAARGLLTSEGRDLGDTTIERVRETLHAAAIDPAARADVAPGRVTRELAHAGLGGIEAAAPPAPVAPAGGRSRASAKPDERPRKGAGRAARSGPRDGAKAAGDDAAGRRAREKEERAAAAARADEERAAETARREAEQAAAARAERERREAARRRSGAERAHREARRALDKAERAGDRAEERLREAQAVADEARTELEAARAGERAASAELDAARDAESDL